MSTRSSALVPRPARSLEDGSATSSAGGASSVATVHLERQLTPPFSDPLACSRWAFGMQLVPLAFSLVLILWKVHVPHPPQKLTPLQLLLKIDWWGFLLLLTSVTALMLSLSLHTASGYALSHPLVWGLFALFVASTVGFWAVEEYWAAEPLIPMSLLKERTSAFVLSAFLLLTLSTFARVRTPSPPLPWAGALADRRLPAFAAAFHGPALPAHRSRLQRDQDRIDPAAVDHHRLGWLALRRLPHAQVWDVQVPLGRVVCLAAGLCRIGPRDLGSRRLRLAHGA